MLEIIPLVLGPVVTNTYLVGDPQSQLAVVVDPAWDGEIILQEAKRRNWKVEQIWLTHAHFDHIGGIADLVKGLPQRPGIALHKADHALYSFQGGASYFGMRIEAGPEPHELKRPGHKQNSKIRILHRWCIVVPG